MSSPRVVAVDGQGAAVEQDGRRTTLSWAALRQGATCPTASVAATYARLLREAEAMAARAA